MRGFRSPVVSHTATAAITMSTIGRMQSKYDDLINEHYCSEIKLIIELQVESVFHPFHQ